jgi:uncharacterized protein
MPGTLTIHSVSDDHIRIGDQVFSHTIALTAEALLDDWPAKAVDDLSESDFAVLLDTHPEVIILGTGINNVFPPRELVFAMARRGVGFEVMNTRAAASTFNVLAGEGRQVAAILHL